MTATPKLSNVTRAVAMGNLRAFITVLVIFHHAALPYAAHKPPLAASLTAQPLMWTAFPVLDPGAFPLGELLVAFNDFFFMSLMFFLSGLFVLQSLRRRGIVAFSFERARRLGIPFLVSAAVLAPLAYYPAYLQLAAATPTSAGFWEQWLSLGVWPAGPAWFLWVLLSFDLAAAGLARVVPGFGERLGRLAARARRPAVFFLAMTALGAVAYLPLAAAVSPLSWASFGPFFVQTARLPLYASWFFAGIAVGADGVDQGLLAADAPLARRWSRWLFASLGCFLAELVLVSSIFQAAAQGTPASAATLTAANLGFVVTCVASCLAFLALFARFGQRSRFFQALSPNAYGMYLVHYVFVSWLAYALLPAQLSGSVKCLLVFSGAALTSVGVARLLRALPITGRFV